MTTRGASFEQTVVLVTPFFRDFSVFFNVCLEGPFPHGEGVARCWHDSREVVKEKTKRRQRKVKHVKSKHRYTILRVKEVRVKSLEEIEGGSEGELD